MNKKKKKLIIALVICLIAAIASLSAVLVLKNRTSSTGSIFSIFSKTDTAPANSEEALVPRKYKKQYEKITSHGIEANPDLQVRAAVFAYMKEHDRSLKMIEFNLLKTYDAFRIYDMSYYSKNYNGDQMAHVLLPVYMEGDSALALKAQFYSTADERADTLTAFIQQLDSDYEKTVSDLKTSGEYLKLF